MKWDPNPGVIKSHRISAMLRSLTRGLRLVRGARVRWFCEEGGAKIVPEVERLLKDVKCEEHADKFSSLEEFMRTSKLVLKLEKGIDSTKQRKWILKQSEYARQLHRLGILKERVLVEEMVEGEELDESAEGEQTEKIS
ncbi:hypothetical protein AAMO2058_000975400 [Amorphochlora amoebiformis]